MTPTINLNRHFFLGGAGPGLLGLMGLALCFCRPVLAANSISWNTATLSFPTSAFTGATIPISATVTNTGTATWDSAYHVVLQDREGVNVTMASVSGTAPGATITVTLYLTLPPMAGTYSYRLTALQHNTEYFGGILPRSVTVAVAPLPQNWSPVFSRVCLSKNLFLSVDPPTIDTNWPTSTYYRLRAKFPIAGNGLGFHAATSTENKGRPLDAVPPPGSYNPVTLYWLRYDANYNLLEQGPGSLQSVGVIEPAVALSSYWFHKRQRPTVVINQNLPANYRLVVHATDAATNAKLAVSWNNAARQLDGLPGAGTYRIEHYWQKYAPDGFTVLEVGKRKTETLTIVDGPNQTFTAAGNITGNDTYEEGSEEPTGRDYSADWYGLQVQTRGSLNLFSSVFTVPDGSSRTSLWYEFFSPDWTLLASGRDLESFNFSVTVEPGEYHLNVGAYDDGGYQLTGIVTSAVPPPLVSNTELPAGVLGVAYPTDVKLVTVPAATVYHAGGLPLGLTCDSRTGQIYGTPLQAGTFEVMLWADNAGMAGDSKILPLTVARGLPVLTFPNRTAYNQPRIYPITTAMLNATVAGLPGMPAPTPKAITYRVSQGSPLTPTGSNPLGKYLSPYENASIKLTATYPGDANYAEISVEATFSDLIKFTPTAPSALRTVLRSPNGFSLAWLPPGGVPPGITTDFQCDVSLDGGATVATTVPYGQLSALIAGRPPATTYQVAVRARDVFGNTSDWSAAISAMTLGVGETPVTVARWLDVNGDGLADEVFDAATPAASGTPVFSHSITATTTHSVNYTEWVQYWAHIPGYTYTTYSYLDNYARSYYVSARWEYAWEEVSQMIDVTVVRPEFITTPREGYIYKVGRLITRPDGTLGLNEIYTINPDVTVDGFNHWFPENFWAEAAYYTIPFVLVRYGKPIGSISLAGQFAAVTVGTTRGLGGILSVPFPASGNVVISLKDLANQVLKAGPKVVWEVWDRINQIRVGTSTVGDLLDLGINTSGEFQVGLKLDDSTQVWFNVSVQPPPAPKLAVDANRDGTITFDAADATSASAPYRFWLNDDDDHTYSSAAWWSDLDPEHFPARRADSDDQIVNSPRDCEDLARMWINAAGLIDTVKDPSSDLYLGLKWKNTNGTHPCIRLFRSADTNGGLGYIKDATIGLQQATITPPGGVGALRSCLGDADAATVSNPPAEFPWTSGITQVEPIVRDADFIFRKDALTDVFGNRTTGYLLFEGVQEGKGELMLVVVRKKSDNTWEKVSEGGSVWLQLDNIRRMYVRVHSEPMASNFPLPWESSVATSPPPFPYTESTDHTITIPDSNLGWGAGDTTENLSQFPFVPTAGEKNKCVVFVHGIDLDVPTQQGYAQSFFKRLWWESYRGRFVAFRWSTVLSTDGLFGGMGPWGPGEENTSIFNSGEYRSWKSGAGLKKYVDALRTQLGSGSVIGVAGHSLGNIAVSEALWQGMRPNSYVAMESAVSVSCYYWSNPGPGEPLPPANLRLVNAESGRPTPLDTAAGGYYGNLASLQSIAGLNRVSYYNADDFWLATGRTAPSWGSKETNWVKNHEAYKPDDRYVIGQYKYDPSVYWSKFERGVSFLRTVTDRHEKMSFISRSRSSAIGAVSAPPGFQGFEMRFSNPYGYGFGQARYDHSGQFQRNIQLMYGRADGTPWVDQNGVAMPFYRRLMSDLQVSP